MVWRGLEVLCQDDGAWYDVDCRRSRVMNTPKGLKVRIRFTDFPADDQEFFGLDDLDVLFRLRSRPWKEAACRDLKPGLKLCAFAEFDEGNECKWMDAVVQDVRRVEHDQGAKCGCIFKVKWVPIKNPRAQEMPGFKILGPRWLDISCICAIQHPEAHLSHPFIMKWKREMILATGMELALVDDATGPRRVIEPYSAQGEEITSTSGAHQQQHRKAAARSLKSDGVNAGGQSKALQRCTSSSAPSLTNWDASEKPVPVPLCLDIRPYNDSQAIEVVGQSELTGRARKTSNTGVERDTEGNRDASACGKNDPEFGQIPRGPGNFVASSRRSPSPAEGNTQGGEFLLCARMIPLNEIRMQKKSNWEMISVRTTSNTPAATPCRSTESSDDCKPHLTEEGPQRGSRSHGEGLKRKAQPDDVEMNSSKRTMIATQNGQRKVKGVVPGKDTTRKTAVSKSQKELSPASSVDHNAGNDGLNSAEPQKVQILSVPSANTLAESVQTAGSDRAIALSDGDCEEQAKRKVEDITTVEDHLPTQGKVEDEKIRDLSLIERGEDYPDDEVVLVMDGSVKVAMEEDIVSPPSGPSDKALVLTGLEGCVDVDPCISRPVEVSLTSQPENVEIYEGLEILCAAAFTKSLQTKDIALPPMQRYKQCAKHV